MNFGLLLGAIRHRTGVGYPTVTTQTATNVTASTATANGTIAATGGANPTVRGVVYSTSSFAPVQNAAPATYGTVVSSSGSFGTGAFTESLTALTFGQIYYYAAYATNSKGTSYGGVQNFTVIAYPTATTQAVSGIAATTATGNGTITGLGGAANCTVEGVVISTTSFGTPANGIDPSTVGTAYFENNGTYGTGAFTVSMTGLAPATLYHVCAFTKNSAGYSYGSALPTFTTLANYPTVTTQAASSVAATSATANGNITATGGVNPTVRGIVYKTSSFSPVQGIAPSTYGTTIQTSGSFGVAAFTESMTGLTPNQIYYYAVYAENSAGYSYGTVVNFTSSVTYATVTTQAATSITMTTATANGDITNLGGAASCSHRGIVRSTSSFSPTSGTTPSTYGTAIDSSGAYGTGTFTESMTGLTAGTTYYCAAYAENSHGYSYGTVVSFATTAPAAAVIVQSKAGGSGSGVSPATSAAGFNGTTVAGNTLLCVVWANGHKLNTGITIAIQTPITSGITWMKADGGEWNDALGDGPYTIITGAVSVYYAQNAPSIPTSATTTVALSTTGSPLATIECGLYEIRGLSGGIDVHTSSYGNGSVPNCGSLILTAQDFVIVATEEYDSNSAVGAGYTLGLEAAVLNNGTIQYNLSAPSGSKATAFGGAAQTEWAAVAVAFKI